VDERAVGVELLRCVPAVIGKLLDEVLIPVILKIATRWLVAIKKANGYCLLPAEC
jgi:hypothetical protein